MALNASANASSSGSASADFLHFQKVTKLCVIYWFFFTIFAAIVMNTVVLVATFLDKRLHNASKYFVACLAVSDLLVVFFSVSVRLHLTLHPHLPLSAHGCFFWIWSDIFAENASITTLTIISVDRYLKVSRPFQYKTTMTSSKARIIIIFLWIYSAIIASLALIPYNDSKGVHRTAVGSCVNDNKTFYSMTAFLVFFVPVMILIIMCALMFRVVKRFHHRRSLSHNDTQIASALPRVHNCREQKMTNSNRRTVGIFSLIVCTFILCWGPFFIFFAISQYEQISLSAKGESLLLAICFNMLPYINTFLNPLIYAYFDKSFKIAIRDLLLKIRGKTRANQNYALTQLTSRDSPHRSVRETIC